MKALTGRLAQHFSFQAAQRLSQGRIEEACAASGGTKWFVKMDRMDQNKTILPTIWGQLRSPFFKNGERIVTGIIGASWHGPLHTQHHIRTIFEDQPHGSESHCSALLMNVHEAALREQSLPEELVVGTDNTPKEGKNSIVLWFITWLLCALESTRLWSVVLTFLLVGHTHDSLDRFFSRFAVALAGHNYYTLPEMFEVARAGMPSFGFGVGHMTHQWGFKSLKPLMPEFRNLRTVHAINIFRRGGIWVKWKQYMTCDTWSTPVLLIPPHQIPVVARFVPDRVTQSFEKRAAMLAWIDKFECSLSDAQQTIETRRACVEWLRRVVRNEHPVYNNGPTIQDILRDLLALRGRPGQAPRGDFGPLPTDTVAAGFPGGDQPLLPVNCLVQVTGKWEPPPPPDIAVPGSMVIVKCGPEMQFNGDRLLFAMGAMLPQSGSLRADALMVEWWVPSRSAAQTFRPGRKKDVVDVFSKWRPLSSVTMAELSKTRLPPVLVQTEDVLEFNFQLEDDKIGYAVLGA